MLWGLLSADMIAIFLSAMHQKQDSLPAGADFESEKEDHVKEAHVTHLSLSVQFGRRHNVFCTFNFLCLNLTRGFCFCFSLYQTEYDNVTWELLDEKISMVPSAFFLSFFFFEKGMQALDPIEHAL